MFKLKEYNEMCHRLQKELHETNDIKITTPLSYINRLKQFNESDKMIFIYNKKANHSKIVPTEGMDTLGDQLHDIIDLDLTGSPLKDEFQIDSILDDTVINRVIQLNSWEIEEEKYTPTTVNLARQYLLKLFKNEYDEGSLWILCDGFDCDCTILMEIEFNKMWRYRGIVKYTNPIAYENIQMNTLVKKHLQTIGGCNNKVDTLIDTYFDIELNCTLRLSWKTTALNAPLNAYNKADVFLNQSIKIGNIESVTWTFWSQLKLLNEIRNVIVKYHETNKESNLKFNGLNENLEVDEIRTQIKQILCDASSFTLHSDISDLNNAIENVIVDAGKREYSDITDNLWILLIKCESYSDLKQAFNYIFQYAAKLNIINIPTNNNRLAELIRDVNHKRLAIPSLVGVEPLELLLECGIEKLTKDYEHIFKESQICSATDLQQLNRDESNDGKNGNVRKTLFNANNADQQRASAMLQTNNSVDSPTMMGLQNSQFNRVESKKNLLNLVQIHLILDHLLLIQNNLNLSNMYTAVAKNVISKKSITLDVLTKPSKLYDECHIQILNDSILLKIGDKQPHSQRIQMKSENKYKKMDNTFYYSLNQIFPTNLFKFMQINSDHDKLHVDKHLYHSFHYMKIGTKRF